MKKIIMMFSLVLCLSTLALAQGGRQMGTPEERAKRTLDVLQTKLNLTADQKQKVTAILMSQAKSMDSLRTAAGEDADRQTLRPKMMAIMAASDKQVNALLTDDQKKAYETWKEERKSRMSGGQQPAPKE